MPHDGSAKKKAKKFADQIAKMKDHLSICVKPVSNGVTMRMTLEPGAEIDCRFLRHLAIVRRRRLVRRELDA